MTLEEALQLTTAYAKEHSPAVIFFQGDLGAGKTHFTNQFAQHIGLGKRLPSPTFSFLQEYKIEWEQKKNLIHCDFYRIEKTEDAEKILEQVGFWDYLDAANILFIEWPERIASHLDTLPHAILTISILPNGDRSYAFST